MRDLFFATPARLKFLKTARAERELAVDAVQRLAMAYPGSPLPSLSTTGANCCGCRRRATARARLAAMLGPRLRRQCARDRGRARRVRLTGLAGLPTLNRAPPRDQYLFVNGRPVRDKLLVGAVRGAYQDFLARDRHPMVALFLDGPEDEIDVNVHPAKAEVRFRDAALVRGLIVGALRHALAAAGHRASTTVAAAAFAAFRPGVAHLGDADPSVAGSNGFAAAASPLNSPFRRPPSAASPRSPKPPVPIAQALEPASKPRSAPRGRSCTRPTSWRRPRPASSSSISTRRMSGWSTSA